MLVCWDGFLACELAWLGAVICKVLAPGWRVLLQLLLLVDEKG